MRFMLYLDKGRLETILSSRNLTINKIAELCSISRQTIYNMCDSTTVFNTTFEKIREYLNIDYRAITTDKSVAFEVLKNAPERIKIASYKLFEFVAENNSDLLIFSKNNNGKYGINNDWNFGIFFPKKEDIKGLKILNQKLSDRVAPYSINIININSAPLWLKLIIKSHYIRLAGNTPEELLFSSRD